MQKSKIAPPAQAFRPKPRMSVNPTVDSRRMMPQPQGQFIPPNFNPSMGGGMGQQANMTGSQLNLMPPPGQANQLPQPGTMPGSYLNQLNQANGQANFVPQVNPGQTKILGQRQALPPRPPNQFQGFGANSQQQSEMMQPGGGSPSYGQQSDYMQGGTPGQPSNQQYMDSATGGQGGAPSNMQPQQGFRNFRDLAAATGRADLSPTSVEGRALRRANRSLRQGKPGVGILGPLPGNVRNY